VAETPQKLLAEMVRQTRERLMAELRTQAEQFEKFEQGFQELRQRQEVLEGAVEEQLVALEKLDLHAEASLEKVLASLNNLITATLPEQVLQILAEEAAQAGARAAVFDIRGRAAWGAAASGFGSSLPEKAFRSLVVPLGVEGPFRKVYETGGHVDANAEQLKRHRNVLNKLKPDPGDPILLLPIRSTGSVSAIFYADPGGQGKPLPTEVLRILSEFAGAQLDRLMALGEGVTSEAAEAKVAEAEPAVEPAAEPEAEEPESVEPAVEASAPAPEASIPAAVESAPPTAAPSELAPAVEEPTPAPAEPPPPPEPPVAAAVETPQPTAAAFDVAALSEAEQRVHKDARRFAKLLVSEIELYNKFKVVDGRKSKDIYRRLKSDIDRSRQTFEKRFGKSVGKQFDYFHEELVKTLAADDPSLLGSDYPGPSA
jgi:hypothetical protein